MTSRLDFATAPLNALEAETVRVKAELSRVLNAVRQSADNIQVRFAGWPRCNRCAC
jgi:hypothetical protein